jgi:hypothetical protein
MSQRHYVVTHEKLGRIEVIGGWDRPLRYSFLVVLGDGGDDEEGVIYSNLIEPDGPDVPPQKARSILESLGIPIPTGFLEALERDRAEKPGNLEAQYLAYAGDGRPQFEVWLRRVNRRDAPFLEETHNLVYTSLEPLGTDLEAGARALHERLNHPRSDLLAARCGRQLQLGDVVRVQCGDGKLEQIERTEDGWRVRPLPD